MFKETYSDLWLQEKDVNINLKSNNGVVNPMAAVKILNAVKRIVNIVHGNNKYEVIFHGQEDSAYINYSKKAIVISSQFLKNPNSNYSIYDIIDIETGLALHESGHAEHTPNPTSIKNKEMYKKLDSNVKLNLHNIIEDAVMEQIVSNDFPGYEAYFIKLRNHYFKKSSIEVSDNKNANRINELLLGLRYTGEAKLFDPLSIKAVKMVKDILALPNEELKNIDRIELTETIYNLIIIPEDGGNSNSNNKQLKPQYDNKNNEYDGEDHGGGISLDAEDGENGKGDENGEFSQNSKSHQIGNDDFEDDKELDPNEAQRNPNGAAGDIKSDIENFDLNNQEIGGELEDFLEQQKKEQESSLDESENALINNITEEEFSENEMETKSGKKYNVITCKPKVIPQDVDIYKKSLKNVNRLIMKFRNKFADANTIYKQNAYGLSRGNLDEDSLYSAKYNRNIFMNNVVSTMSRTKNIDIAFTIDCSGSMWDVVDTKSSKLRFEAARDLAILFTEALAPINSINTWVFGFQESFDYLSRQLIRSNSKINIYNLPQEEREKLHYSTQLVTLYSPYMKTKHAIGSLYPSGYTPEYEGLTETINMLNKQGKKGNKKVVVMLTDGGPYSAVFGSHDQILLIKDKLKECKKKDITVIHLALTSEAERTPYENKVKWDSNKGYEGLVDGFIKMLQKQIS